MDIYWSQDAFKLGCKITKALQFETLVRTHQGAVRAFLRRLTGDTVLADDLAQDSFLKAFGRYDELQNPDAAKAWLFSIAYRCFLDSYKKSRRRKTLLQEHPLDAYSSDILCQAPAGLALDIERAMANLPVDCRVCVMLSISEGYTHNEIEVITTLPLGTIKTHISRGKEKLKTALKSYQNALKQIG